MKGRFMIKKGLASIFMILLFVCSISFVQAETITAEDGTSVPVTYSGDTVEATNNTPKPVYIHIEVFFKDGSSNNNVRIRVDPAQTGTVSSDTGRDRKTEPVAARKPGRSRRSFGKEIAYIRQKR